ncbi:MAG TPA: MerR family transcriptional regulator [Gammaproteobacteria bacterium]|nr:MerR family transcriptional regulator [Gammaproteobacteria bacterium]
MRIGELANLSGMKADTVRYYEKAGLLPPPPRLPNGYRDYGAAHVERLAFIRHCRTLGMPLEDVHSLLDFIVHPDADCQVVDQLIDDQLVRVRARIASLRTLARQLQTLRAQCRNDTSVRECGILQELVAAAHDEACVCHPAAKGEGRSRTGD